MKMRQKTSNNIQTNQFHPAELIMTDHKHIENNPVQVTKDDIIKLLNRINTEQIFRID